MKKDELLKQIKKGVWYEERAVPVYIRHIIHSLPWYGFPEEDEEAIRDILNTLAEDSEQHRQTLENIRGLILGSEKNVF